MGGPIVSFFRRIETPYFHDIHVETIYFQMLFELLGKIVESQILIGRGKDFKIRRKQEGKSNLEFIFY